jgi:very-short-patch-repair endonuclease
MPAEPHIRHCSGGERAAGLRERVIAALAEVQHGVVSRLQLRAEGFTDREIDRRIAQGRLHVVYRGVFAVGRRELTREGWWMAAVLATGPGAVLSHRPAGALRGLIKWGGWADVTVPGRRRPRRGILIHEGRVAADEWCIEDGIPVTTVARTLIDLAAVLDRERLFQAVSKAEALQLTDVVALPALLERHRGRRGIVVLREIVEDRRLGLDIARSDLEIDFQTFLRERGFVRPEINAVLEVGGRRLEVDCLWLDQHVIVEVDSRQHHAAWDASESDRARDRTLIAAGYVPLRVTWKALHLQPDQLEGELRAALARRAAPLPP